MQDNFIVILTFLYSIGGIVTFIGFFPTIKDLWNGKPSANITTFSIWFITTVITSIYGFFVLKNVVFNIVINLQVIATFIVLILAIKLKYKKIS